VLSLSLVDGPSFSSEASLILEEAWQPPVLRYTPEYLEWQLAFPSERVKTSSVAAFDGDKAIGFAGTTARRLRYGVYEVDVTVVSFVAVRPEWQGRGVGAALYRTLLADLAERGMPVVTYAIPGSAGEKALLHAYSKSGFHVQPIGVYNNFAFVARGESDSQWRAFLAEDAGMLASAIAELPKQESILLSMPTQAQSEHYLTDPRPRKLIVIENTKTGARGAAFAIRSELRTVQGGTTLTTLDTVWLPDGDTSGLVTLLRFASTIWGDPGAGVVSCPNLSGFDLDSLRVAGIRKSGGQFAGYFCSTTQSTWPTFQRTNLEIV
jgi:GNAT superfamily N-acetyltransferase